MDEEFEVKIKAWYKSVTVWSIILYVVAMFIIELTPTIREILPGAHLWLSLVESIALLYLRIFHTRQPVTLKAAVKPMIEDQAIIRDNPPLTVKEEPIAGTHWRIKTKVGA